LTARYEAWTDHGIRVLAVAERSSALRRHLERDDERDLTFVGFTFLDRPKQGTSATIEALGRLGVAVVLPATAA
jgi:Mg2+-importing ATPase